MLLSACLFVIVATPGRTWTPTGDVSLLIPAYIYPASAGLADWDRIIATAAIVPTVAIFNPDSGPGLQPDPNDLAIVAKASKAGLALIDYIHTSYGSRPLRDVEGDVQKYLEFYPKAAAGFFVDEQSASGSTVAYYRDLAVFIRDRAPKARIYSNPGTICSEQFLTEDTADVFLIHETSGVIGNMELPAWILKYPSNRFAAVAYDVASTHQMTTSLQAMVSQHVGNAYVTNLTLPNPYNALPSYWDDEVSEISRISDFSILDFGLGN